jgi:type IV pilus assembly protein PilB
MAAPGKKRFGDILVEGGLITATQLQQALTYGKERDLKVGQALQELGFVNETSVAKTLSSQLKIPFVDFDKVVIDPEIAKLLPETVARKNKAMALGRRPGEVLVAFADPLNIFAIDEVTRHLEDKLVSCVGVESLITKTIERIFTRKEKSSLEKDTGGGDESAAVSAVNDLLLQAVRSGSSDIHIEPAEDKLRVRSRVDGMLRITHTFPIVMHPSIVSRIKILSQMDIGEKRKPQDGRFEIPVSGRSFDVRVSTLPLNQGEKVVMRLLDKSKVKINMSSLGFDPEQQKIFEEHLHRPHEIILVTGPTGSGKTTTLYAALNYINSVDKNIVTVEDPVEYELAGINQVQINPKAHLTFESALRSILRQDPDVIMIGEIRDVETAEIAIQSALTGHMVLSTLHTNDSCGAVTRLIEMGIKPFLIASALGLVVAQRLTRQLCQQCKEAFTPPESLQQELGLDYDPARKFYRPGGCGSCDGVGYKGRLGIYEILRITKAVEMLIINKASSHEIFRQAQKDGLVSLRHSGISKMLEGKTSIDEVLRVSMDSKE